MAFQTVRAALPGHITLQPAALLPQIAPPAAPELSVELSEQQQVPRARRVLPVTLEQAAEPIRVLPAPLEHLVQQFRQ